LTLLSSLERPSLEVPSWHRVEVRVFASLFALFILSNKGIPFFFKYKNEFQRYIIY
jgi:hypothetical protein